MTTAPGGPGRTPSDLLEAIRNGRLADAAGRREAAARLVDATFVEELFRALRSTLEEEGAPGTGGHSSAFMGMMDQHLAEVAAHRMRLGFGEKVLGGGPVDPGPGGAP